VTARRAHAFVAGQSVNLAVGGGLFPVGVKTVASVISSTQFTYTEAGADGSGGGGDQFYAGALPYGVTDAQLTTSADARTNRTYFSLPAEPWAVPPSQFFDVGSPADTILAYTPIRDRLIVWTDNGTYQVTGSYPNYNVSELDLSVSLIAPDSAALFNGAAYGLTNKGLVTITEGARIVGVPVDDTLRDDLANHRSNYRLSFAAPYETQNMLLVFVASSAAQPAEAFIFHGGTEKFTRMVRAANAGFVRPSDDKLLLFDTSGHVWTERKTLTGDDVYDDPVSFTSINITPTSATSATVSSAAQLAVGDSFTTDDGGYVGLITSIDGTTIGFEANADLYVFGPDGVNVVRKAIPSVIEPLQFLPAGPGAQALVGDGSIDFKQEGLGRMWLQMATNLMPTLSAAEAIGPKGYTPMTAAGEVVFGVPYPYQTATRYRVRLSLGEAGRTFGYQGMTLNSTAIAQKPGR
jgi:hypothetical protein